MRRMRTIATHPFNQVKAAMTDPRNIAHDKKIQHDKEHRGEEIAPDAEHTPQPGKKPHLEHHKSDVVEEELTQDGSPDAVK